VRITNHDSRITRKEVRIVTQRERIRLTTMVACAG